MSQLAAALLAMLGVAAPAAGGAPLGEPGPLVKVGPGAAESSVRQPVRTPDGRVYIAAADDEGLDAGPAATLRMYRADQTGVPTSFSQADPAHAPRVTGGATIGAGDARLDEAGLIHVVYLRTDTDAVVHQTFSTRTDTWGAAETVASAPGASRNSFGDRGRIVVALALDASGVPFVAVTAGGSARVYRRQAADSWEPSSIGPGDLHPSLTFDRAGRLHAAWLDDPATIRYARRDAGGTWSVTGESVASGVLTNGNRDQGPSIAVDAAGEPVVLYLVGTPGGNDNFVRVRTRGPGGWTADDPSPDVFAHTPGMHMRGDDRFVLLGHDAYPVAEPAYISRAAGAAGWSDLHRFEPGSDYDGSANSRFDPLHDTNCNVIDAAFFDESSNDDPGAFRPALMYTAIRLPAVPCGDAGGAPGAGEPDLTPPVVSSVRLTKRRWRRGDRHARLRFGLSEAATVTATIERAVGGRRVRGRCRRGAHHGRRCRVWARRTRFRISGSAGRQSVAFGSRRAVRRLRPGRYRLRLRARDAAGNRSRVTSRRFTVRRAASRSA